MKTQKQQIPRASEIIGVDTISKLRNGNYIARKGFFYTMGQTPETLVNKIKEVYNIEVINKGQVWKPFKGGSTIKGGSHFYVEFKLV